MYFAASMRERNPFVDNVKPVTSLVWMGIQEESFPFKLRHAYKLVNFVLRVGNVLSLKARELLLEDKDVDVVVFGHDHRYYSNEHGCPCSF